jgi:hypothetical protein
MGDMASSPLIRTLLESAESLPWRMQDLGLMGLRLDDRREFRLHVWDPSRFEEELPIHDHPYSFTSTVIAGELANTRYVEDDHGDEYVRFRYSPGAEVQRRSDAVRLSAASTTFKEGERYAQLAHELHSSSQLPGTVTLIRCSWLASSELTVCFRDKESWTSGVGRDATPEEIRSFAAKALEWF